MPIKQPAEEADMIKDDHWSNVAKYILKSELKRRGLTYLDLQFRLGEIGVIESEPNIRNKISRGSFSASFLLKCLSAIGCTKLDLEYYSLRD